MMVFEPLIIKAEKFYDWTVESCKGDPIFRIVVAGIVWILILYSAQFLAYRQIQVALFEIPQDRLISKINNFEIFQSFRLFPWSLLLSPLIAILASPIVLYFNEKSIEFGAIKGKRHRSAWFQVAIILTIGLIFGIYKLVFDSLFQNTYVLFGSIVSYLFAMLLLNSLFSVKLSKEENTSNATIGYTALKILTAAFLMLGSIVYISEEQSYGQQSKKYIGKICDSITQVNLELEKNHISGWLISRDEYSTLIRMKQDSVYDTIELKTESIKNTIYKTRFGANEEKYLAFPSCNIDI